MNVITEKYIRTQLDKMVKDREDAKRMAFEAQKRPAGRPPRPPVQKLKGRYVGSASRPPQELRKYIDPELLMSAVERVTGISRTAICKTRLRVNRILIPRHLLTWLLLTHTDMSLAQSGHATGRTDHSSALNSFNVVVDNPTVFKPLIDKVYSQLMVEQNVRNTSVNGSQHRHDPDDDRRYRDIPRGAADHQTSAS